MIVIHDHMDGIFIGKLISAYRIFIKIHVPINPIGILMDGIYLEFMISLK
jgi:hypothetical protein